MLPRPMMEPATDRMNSILLPHSPRSSIFSSEAGRGSLAALVPLGRPALAESPAERGEGGKVGAEQWLDAEGLFQSDIETAHRVSSVLFEVQSNHYLCIRLNIRAVKSKFWRTSSIKHADVLQSKLTFHCSLAWSRSLTLVSGQSLEISHLMLKF